MHCVMLMVHLNIIYMRFCHLLHVHEPSILHYISTKMHKIISVRFVLQPNIYSTQWTKYFDDGDSVIVIGHRKKKSIWYMNENLCLCLILFGIRLVASRSFAFDQFWFLVKIPAFSK